MDLWIHLYSPTEAEWKLDNASLLRLLKDMRKRDLMV
jgi:hypothetical protein